MSVNLKNFEPLSVEELRRIATARAEARARFAHVLEEDDEDEASGVVDPDNPPLTDAQLAQLRPAAEVAPGLVAASLRRAGGRPRSPAPKVAVSMRLDPDLLATLRSSGEGWQRWANDTLRRALDLPVSSDVARTVHTAADPLRPTEGVAAAAGRAVRFGRVFVYGGTVTREVFDGTTLRMERESVKPGAGDQVAPEPDRQDRDEPSGVR